jgi:dTDP-4-dehydrorhamnose 3,5-epimerase
MGAISLADIIRTELRRIETPGGDVMHAIKMTAPGFAGFGEAYFSWVEAGAVKAWKKHNRMVMNMVVPHGLVQVVFYDDTTGHFREELIGAKSYARLTVPPGIWFGFKGIADSPSLLLNIASIEHDPLEVERLPLTDIKYNW